MLAILNVTAPFFALVLCGYLAARYRMLPENAVPALNTFVLYFALPCMLFRFAAGAPFHDILNLSVFLAYMVTGLAILALSAAAAHYAAGESVREAAFAALAVSWSNWGYMGIPLIPALLGQAALAALIAAGMADLLVVTSAALALASLENRAGGGDVQADALPCVHVSAITVELQSRAPGALDRRRLADKLAVVSLTRKVLDHGPCLLVKGIMGHQPRLGPDCYRLP